jgi:glycerol-3-phosphate dehydrogenase
VPLPTASPSALAADVPATVSDHDIAPDVLAHLTAAYGPARPSVLALTAARPEYADRVSETAPVIAAQIAWAARHEMAVTLADAVIRRTPLGALGHPGTAALTRAATVMAAELDWSPERATAEIRSVDAFFDQ